MMKILVTLDFPPDVGGIQRYLHETVTHRYSCGDLVIAGSGFRSGGDDEYPCPVKRMRFPIPVPLKKILLLPMVPCLLHTLIRKGFSARIEAGNVYAALVPALLSFLFPVRYRVYCYGSELLALGRRYSLKVLILKSALRRAEALYYLTNVTLRILRDTCRCDNRCIQAYPRIDIPAHPVVRKVHPDGIIRLLSVGRLVHHKGHSVLLEAVAGMGTAAVPWHLTIAGDGPCHGMLMEKVKEMNGVENVVIDRKATDTDICRYYGEADIFILPSIETEKGVEGFGIVLLDAMAYGASIIASRSGGIEEVVGLYHGCAELVPPGDPESLRKALILLIKDDERRFRAAIAARRLLEERYVW